MQSQSLTRLVLGAALRDVGAQHGAYSRVRCKAPWEFLAIWIPAVVFFQIPGKQQEMYSGYEKSAHPCSSDRFVWYKKHAPRKIILGRISYICVAHNLYNSSGKNIVLRGDVKIKNGDGVVVQVWTPSLGLRFATLTNTAQRYEQDWRLLSHGRNSQYLPEILQQLRCCSWHLGNLPDQIPSRLIINFGEMSSSWKCHYGARLSLISIDCLHCVSLLHCESNVLEIILYSSPDCFLSTMRSLWWRGSSRHEWVMDGWMDGWMTHLQG